MAARASDVIPLSEGWNLSDAVHGEIILRVELSHTATRSQAAVSDPGHSETIFSDVGRAFSCFFHISRNKPPGEVEDIGRLFLFAAHMFFVDQDGPFLHGLFRVEDGRKNFIFDLDQMERLLGDLGICGSDRSDLIPQRADLICLERDIVFINTELDGRNVVARQDGLHPGKLFRFRGIDAFYLCMGMGTVKDFSIKHPRNLQVVNIDRLARDLFLRIHLGDSFSNVDELFHDTSMLEGVNPNPKFQYSNKFKAPNSK